MTRRLKWKGAVALGSLILAVSVPALATTKENFELRNGADLVELCSTDTSDPLYTAAIQMCQGFGVGVYRTALALTAKDDPPLFCPPSGGLTRNAAVQSFLTWAASNKEHAGDSALDFIGRFFMKTYPCESK